ncbi:MAG TPA: ATP-binding protein [Pirellulales bacterium]|nr:ATP-binding protein [Pirellulales bacterium]
MTTSLSFPDPSPGTRNSHGFHEPSAGQPAPRSVPASPSQATALVELAAAAELWHAADGAAYATIEVENWREHWRLRSRPFAQWLAARHFATCGGAPHTAALADALGVLEARARFDGAERRVFSRVAGHEEQIYLDLGDQQWRAVAIGPGRWSVVERPPVRFRRARAVLALPEPKAGRSLNLLRRFVNVADDDWALVAAWLVAALRPTGPYPILFLHGEQGSGKSTQARVLRSLIDPNSAPLRAGPREAHDLALAANNSWVIALDNLSRLPGWLSDALCRLSTGGGFATRTLYENEEETIFDAQRPVLVTGIEDLASRSDLLDRALVVHLPSIAPDRRRAESDFWREFHECRPWLVGALVEAVATALARLPDVRLPKLPRLADFAQWATAAEPALGCENGEFAQLYARHKETVDLFAIESSPISLPLIKMARVGPWRGTASQLLAALEQKALAAERRRSDWPRGLAQLSGLLRRLAPILRTFNILVEFTRGDGSDRQRMINVRHASDAAVKAP